MIFGNRSIVITVPGLLSHLPDVLPLPPLLDTCKQGRNLLGITKVTAFEQSCSDNLPLSLCLCPAFNFYSLTLSRNDPRLPKASHMLVLTWAQLAMFTALCYDTFSVSSKLLHSTVPCHLVLSLFL